MGPCRINPCQGPSGIPSTAVDWVVDQAVDHTWTMTPPLGFASASQLVNSTSNGCLSRRSSCYEATVQVYTIRDSRDRDPGQTGHPPAVLAAEVKLRALSEKLAHARSPHMCHYQVFEIRSSLAYMVRPFVYSTLHERVQVRLGLVVGNEHLASVLECAAISTQRCRQSCSCRRSISGSACCRNYCKMAAVLVVSTLLHQHRSRQSRNRRHCTGAATAHRYGQALAHLSAARGSHDDACVWCAPWRPQS
jgi:hypothetical protein